MFFGVIADDPGERFTQASFLTTTGTGDVFGFDDMNVGSLQQANVPVPAAGVLAAAGFGLLGLMGYRRKQG